MTTNNRASVLSILNAADRPMTTIEIWRASGLGSTSSVRDTLNNLAKDGVAYRLPSAPGSTFRDQPTLWRKATR